MESGIFAAGLMSLAVGGAMTLRGWNIIRQDRRREAARTALLSQMARAESSAATETLFSKPESLGAVSRRTAALAAISLALAFAIGAFFGLLSLDTSSAAVTSAAPPSDAVVSTTTVSVPSPVQTPPRVELLALTSRATPDAFVVTGEVRNPAGGARLTDVVAVVEVVDSAGSVLMTVRAPLTAWELNAGENSAFSATASKVTNVARYRVEFQDTARVVIPHADRRQRAAN